MSEPAAKGMASADSKQTIGHLFRTPITVRGLSWLPLTQAVIWWLMTRLVYGGRPDRSPSDRRLLGFLTMLVTLGSEWCHNLAHLVGAHLTGHPMDEFHIIAGMPRCVYYDLNDSRVSPSDHMLRAIGGPVFNLTMLAPSAWARRSTADGSIAHDVAEALYASNLFLSTVSLLPIPGIDGGPLLKWGLVRRGRSIKEADETVRKVNGPVSGVLAVAALVAWSRGRRWLSGLAGVLAAASFAVFVGWIEEEKIQI
jgi:Zn-dependent protease